MVIKLFCKNRSFLLILILIFSAFFRLYRLGPNLGFWYDQGRDALVIWDLLHYGKFFLIGPVTGIDGIYLGPFYYYLLTPFYWLGKGSPVYPAIALSLMGVGSVYLVYWLGNKIYNSKTGLFAALLYGFNTDVIYTNRWLANPNPLPFFTLLTWFFIYRFIKGSQLSLIIASLLVGLCLQLEAASATFFVPALILIVGIKRKNIKHLRIVFVSLASFLITLVPQLLFNFRHEGILLESFQRFLLTEKSFSLNPLQLLTDRLTVYFDVLFRNPLPNFLPVAFISLALFSATILIFRKKIFNHESKLLLIWVLVPLIGYILYRGNHGYLWGYYLVGVIPIFTIIYGAVLNFLWDSKTIGKVLVGFFLISYVLVNTRQLINYLKAGIGIKLQAQLKALDWIYQNQDGSDFNYDAYVPPQIYYAYSYLFRWYGKEKYGYEPEVSLVRDLYTIAEPDDEHPQFLTAWRKRQDGIGIIKDNYSWGDITVEKRERVLYE